MEPLERLLNLVGLAAGDPHAADVRADPGDPRAVSTGERRLRQAHVRARQGHPARLRRAPAAGRHRRLGDRAGLRDPEGRVLPAGDRVHPGGARGAVRGGTERCGTTRPRRRASASSCTGPRGACWRASPADRSPRARTRAATVGHGGRRRRAGRRRACRFGYRTSQGTASERDVDAYADAVPCADTGTSWGTIANATSCASFRLSRFTTGPHRRRARGASRRRGSGPTDHVAAGPWAAAGEDRAAIAFSPDIAWWATGSLAGAEHVRTRRRRVGRDPRARRRRGELAPHRAAVRSRRRRATSRRASATRSSRRLEALRA